jgi:hypothetical protein
MLAIVLALTGFLGLIRRRAAAAVSARDRTN